MKTIDTLVNIIPNDTTHLIPDIGETLIFSDANTKKLVTIDDTGVVSTYTTDDGTVYAPLSGAAFTGVIFPQQATTLLQPDYVKGGLYFDTTSNKLMVGGATAWETVVSA